MLGITKLKVYCNAGNNQAVAVHRGSLMQLFFQKNNQRFKISKKVQKEAENKNEAHNGTTVGSSLGGYLAEEFGQNSKEVITISKPATPCDKRKGEGRKSIWC